MASTDFTIADVLVWARTKPAGERYDYENPSNCALCHFLRETGRALSPSVSPYIGGEPDPSAGWKDGDILGKRNPYPPEMEIALSDRLGGQRWTFGALVARLEKLCPETPVNASNWQSIDAYLSDIEAVELA